MTKTAANNKTELIKELETLEGRRSKFVDQLREREESIEELNKAIADLKLRLMLLDTFPKADKSTYLKWARSFYETCSFDSFKKALEYANTPNLEVYIERATERGPVEWVILPESDPNFWLEVCKTKKAAVAFCKAMGWKI